MLIRFVINNISSFGSQKEFNLLPNTRLGTLKDHIYKFSNFEVLKLSAIYGANGAGKSNLVHGLSMLKFIITQETIPAKLRNGQFKFQKNETSKPQLLAVEFMYKDTTFYYGLEIINGIILTEELYESGMGLKEDILIFERKTHENEETNIRFSEDFERDEKNQILKEILIQEFVKPNKPVLKLISNRDNKDLQIVKKAYEWFDKALTTIFPDAKPKALSFLIDSNSSFKDFTDSMMGSLCIGINHLHVQKEKVEDFFGKDNEEQIQKILDKVEESPEKMISIKLKNGKSLEFVKKDNQVFINKLQLVHLGTNDNTETFELEEESDGTIRLLDFLPAFYNLVNQNFVFIIDEIERSLHPLVVKELVKKFSLDNSTKGQLIFTTHESNLLDQEIFRTDEIWFAEKDNAGSTDLYSLSAFKEHKTIDIQKGYLNGRYGAIPFLGNLQDLNWHDYATQE